MMSLMGRGEPSQGLITYAEQSGATDDKTTVQSQSGNESSGLQTGVINSCLQTGVSSSGLQTGVIESGSVSGGVEDIGVICLGSSQSSTESRHYNPALRLVHCNLYPTIY